jgi:hypothetical protein
VSKKLPWFLRAPGGVPARKRALTEDKSRASWQFDAQMKLFRRAYETSTGIERHRYLSATLAACGPLEPRITDSDYRVPKWLYKALCEQEAALLRQVEPDIHWVRWLMVCEGKRQKRQVWVRGKLREKEWTWPQARKYASEKLTDPPWAGGRDAMKRSYDLVKRIQRRLG